MSQPAICNKCKDAGFPDEKITFQKNGIKPDGSIKWKPVNLDSTEHKHKTKASTLEPNDAKVDEMKDLAAAIRELAIAIRGRKI